MVVAMRLGCCAKTAPKRQARSAWPGPACLNFCWLRLASPFGLPLGAQNLSKSNQRPSTFQVLKGLHVAHACLLHPFQNFMDSTSAQIRTVAVPPKHLPSKRHEDVACNRAQFNGSGQRTEGSCCWTNCARLTNLWEIHV